MYLQVRGGGGDFKKWGGGGAGGGGGGGGGMILKLGVDTPLRTMWDMYIRFQ